MPPQQEIGQQEQGRQLEGNRQGQEHGGPPVTARGVAEERGNNQEGPRPADSGEAAVFVLITALDVLVFAERVGAEFERLEDEKVGEADHHVLELVLAPEEQLKVYVNKETNMITQGTPLPVTQCQACARLAARAGVISSPQTLC